MYITFTFYLHTTGRKCILLRLFTKLMTISNDRLSNFQIVLGLCDAQRMKKWVSVLELVCHCSNVSRRILKARDATPTISPLPPPLPTPLSWNDNAVLRDLRNFLSFKQSVCPHSLTSPYISDAMSPHNPQINPSRGPTPSSAKQAPEGLHFYLIIYVCFDKQAANRRLLWAKLTYMF